MDRRTFQIATTPERALALERMLSHQFLNIDADGLEVRAFVRDLADAIARAKVPASAPVLAAAG